MIIRNHLAPALGQIKLTELTAPQIQQYLNRKQGEGLCSNTIRKHHGVLHNALEHARKQELVRRNVAEYAVPPSSSRPEHHFYDSETMSKLFELLSGTSLEPVVKLAGYLGLRRSEICGLKWSHVDREAKVITIAEARTAVKGEGLEEMAALGEKYQDGGFVVCHNGGKPYQPDYLSNRLQRVLRTTELPYVTLHGLRHSFASMANSRNVPLFGISKALGHSNTTTTTQIYMHLFDDTHLSVVQEVGRAIDGR